MWPLLLFIGLSAALASSVFAYVIMYGEWVHHFVDRRDTVRLALKTAAVAFVFIFVLALLAEYALTVYLSQ